MLRIGHKRQRDFAQVCDATRMLGGIASREDGWINLLNENFLAPTARSEATGFAQGLAACYDSTHAMQELSQAELGRVYYSNIRAMASRQASQNLILSLLAIHPATGDNGKDAERRICAFEILLGCLRQQPRREVEKAVIENPVDEVDHEKENER